MAVGVKERQVVLTEKLGEIHGKPPVNSMFSRLSCNVQYVYQIHTLNPWMCAYGSTFFKNQ